MIHTIAIPAEIPYPSAPSEDPVLRAQQSIAENGLARAAGNFIAATNAEERIDVECSDLSAYHEQFTGIEGITATFAAARQNNDRWRVHSYLPRYEQPPRASGFIMDRVVYVVQAASEGEHFHDATIYRLGRDLVIPGEDPSVSFKAKRNFERALTPLAVLHSAANATIKFMMACKNNPDGFNMTVE